MHFCVYVMIGKNKDVEAAVAEALQPFDESVEAEPYRVHFDRDAVRTMAARYGVDPANLHLLAKFLPDWFGAAGGVDRDGLYALSTSNPDGRFDWYEIGGRCEGRFEGSNVVDAAALAEAACLKDALPYFLLNPAGEWLEQERYYPSKNGLPEKVELSEEEWLEVVRAELRRWPDRRVVCVDCHC